MGVFSSLTSPLRKRASSGRKSGPDNRGYYTFIIAPTATSKIHRLHIPNSALYAVCGLAIIGFATVSTGVVAVLRKTKTLAEMSAIRIQNRQLRQENQSLKLHYEELSQRIAGIQDISTALAIQAKLPQANPPAVARNAAGGPEVADKLESETLALERELRQLKSAYDQDALQLSSTPSGLPVRGYLTDGFGARPNPFSGEGHEFHAGQDISVPYGTPVQATADGVVLYAAPRAGYGNVVVIAHANGISTRYGHLASFDVNAGDRVRRGDVIGRAGNTGRSTGTHVHYEVREYDVPVDPLRYAPGFAVNAR
jgi:murein DD-endopeptidase MepM/ murein hydrolase activator NlpD